MYFCKFNFVPGKLYKNQCHYPYGGYERVDTKAYRVLLTNKEYQWVAVDAVSRDEIKEGAVKGGMDQGNDTIYLCRMKMSDGVHPGTAATFPGATRNIPIRLASSYCSGNSAALNFN